MLSGPTGFLTDSLVDTKKEVLGKHSHLEVLGEWMESIEGSGNKPLGWDATMKPSQGWLNVFKSRGK